MKILLASLTGVQRPTHVTLLINEIKNRFFSRAINVAIFQEVLFEKYHVVYIVTNPRPEIDLFTQKPEALKPE
jgi:hypothetical protein